MWIGNQEKRFPYGWLMLGTGPRRIKFVVQLVEFSATHGNHQPYCEFTLRGTNIEFDTE